MDSKIYWVGEKPGGRITVTVLDAAGNPANLNSFTGVRLRMLDTDNNEVAIGDTNTDFVNKTAGTVTFAWPTTRSLFEKAGEYLLQLELSTASAKRYTSVQSILVKEFGGTK